MKKNPQIQAYGKLLTAFANALDPHQAYKDFFSAIPKAFPGFSSDFVNGAFAILDTIYEYRREGDKDLTALLDLLIQEENLKLSVSLCFENHQMQIVDYDRETGIFKGCSVVYKYEATDIDDPGAAVPHYSEEWKYNFETLRELFGEKLGVDTIEEIKKLRSIADQISQTSERTYPLEMLEKWATYYHQRVRSYRRIQRLQQQVQCTLVDIMSGHIKNSKPIKYFLSIYEKIGHTLTVRADGTLEDITGLRLSEKLSNSDFIFRQHNQYEKIIAFCLVKLLEKSDYQKLIQVLPVFAYQAFFQMWI